MDHFKILSLSLRFAPICSFDPSHNHLMLNNRAMFQHGSFFISDHFGSFRMVHFQCVMLKSSFSLCLNPAILWIQMDGQAAEKYPFFFFVGAPTQHGRDTLTVPCEEGATMKFQALHSHMLHVYPCMVYLPTKLGDFCWANVGKYSSTMEHMGFSDFSVYFYIFQYSGRRTSPWFLPIKNHRILCELES